MNSRLKASDVICDNDPRMKGRKLLVERIECQYVYARPCANPKAAQVRLLLNRVHTDGKPRKSGFSKEP